MSGHVHEGPAGRQEDAGRPGSAAARSEGRLVLALALTVVYMLVEAAAGLLTNSLVLLADAGHMLADVLALAMALFAIRFARRPATPAKTYGFYRAEILAALVNSVILFGIAVSILYGAARRLPAPPEVQAWALLAVAAGGLAVNLVGMRLLHAGAGESLAVRGAFLEMFADLLGSLSAILAGAVIVLTGWLPADPLLSAAVALLILPRAWRLLTGSLDVLLEATPAHIDVGRVESAMRGVTGVRSVHDVHVWTITSGFVAMSGHVEASGRRSREVLHDLQILLRRDFGIEHATLQVEQPDHADDGACCTIDPRCLVVGRPPADLPRRPRR